MFTLNCNGSILVMDKPLIMGIINLTPDSFYAGSRRQQMDEVLFAAEKMLRNGATFLDVGGQSTRPSSQLLSADEELQRVINIIATLSNTFKEAYISIDTFYARVAAEAVAAGACLVNDISAGSLDEELLNVVATLGVPYVLMHMKGTPQNMQQNPLYENVVTEVFDALNHKLAAVQKMGIKDVIIDPGFGFGKTIQHNFQLLHRLKFFTQLNRPLLVGLSRKATVYKTLGITPEEALNGSTVLHTLALQNGAQLLRTHDVKEAAEAIQLMAAYNSSQA